MLSKYTDRFRSDMPAPRRQSMSKFASKCAGYVLHGRGDSYLGSHKRPGVITVLDAFRHHMNRGEDSQYRLVDKYPNHAMLKLDAMVLNAFGAETMTEGTGHDDESCALYARMD